MIKITEELAQNILNYLATKPYKEVYLMIDHLKRQANEEKGPTPRIPKKPSTVEGGKADGPADKKV